MIDAMGYNKVDMAELDNGLRNYDFIFNTVPAMILDESRIDKLKKECIIVDLASKPGGVDFEKAKEKRIEAILALRSSGESRTIISSKIYAKDNPPNDSAMNILIEHIELIVTSHHISFT
ncbi:MAG: hypothetical protein FWC79_03570 [Oscillospiraceae bacterium]|nr:hypothetical protein [Oscillospiraceae bacterium]